MRHGEKHFETLVSGEEFVRCSDMGKYFRITSDARDLNYAKYFSDGVSELENMADYSSNNTELLNVKEIKDILLKLDIVRKAIGANMRVMTLVGTRPEIIRLSEIIKKLDQHTDHILIHTGQNFDYELNQVFFSDLQLWEPNEYLDVARETVAKSIAAIIEKSDAVFATYKPDAVLILGDTNSALAAISAKTKDRFFIWKLK